MRFSSLTVSVLLLAAIPAGLASSQNDAGSGGDAPDTWNSQVALSAGTYAGALDLPHGDVADWYAGFSDYPAYHPSVHVHLEGASVRLKASGVPLNAPADADIPTAFPFAVEPTADAPNATLAYSLTLSFPPTPDVRIAAMSVTVTPGSTIPGLSSTSTLHVVLENVGDAAWHSTFQATANGNGVTGLFGSQAIVRDNLSIPAGGSVTRDYAWDSAGDVGNVTVYGDAYFIQQGDLDSRDNHAQTQASMPTTLPGGYGFVVPDLVPAPLRGLP